MSHLQPWPLNGKIWAVWYVYWLVGAYFTSANKTREGLFGRIAYTVLLLAGFFLLFHDRDAPFIFGRFFHSAVAEWLGLGITAAGLSFAVWARVHLGKYWSGVITLKEGHRLIRTGPYGMVRHPIYTGIVLAAIGSVIANASGDAMVGLILIVAALGIKIRREENLLGREFGQEYLEYRRQVPALVPRPGGSNH
ncbi:MAG TPA: isoprenylcysteine carboxylmethyltransferase family protein [Tepidisphaeraceae bacterium]|nr:isoprenylcysteine carboxylmethyltransferase family protein [Tepidisphaeraceae bacterium]